MKKLPLISFICGIIAFAWMFLPGYLNSFGLGINFPEGSMINWIIAIFFWIFVFLALVFGVISLFKKPKGNDLAFAILGIVFAFFIIATLVLGLYALANFD